MCTELKKMARGELTAFLSLIFLLLLSLVGAVLESASIQVMKNERRADAGRAMESIFAEYQKDLFDEYGIFAIEGSYESGEFSESGILNRLSYYGAENLEMKISQIRYLTDQSGKAFYEQAVELMKEQTGMAFVEELLEEVSFWETFDNKWEVYEKEDKETSEELNQILQDNESELPNDNNPINIISNIKSAGIQKFVLPETFDLSEKVLNLGEMPSSRTLQYGNWSEEEDGGSGTIFFNLYLMDHFSHALEMQKEKTLTYELEYLLEGKESDKENLETVLWKLCNLRFAADYLYLMSDSAKQTEARTFAGTMCTLLTIPGITELVTQAILLAWAYGEAVVDVRTLMSGGTIKLLKDAMSWKLSLEGLLELKEISGNIGIVEEEGGMKYEEYLRMLLFFKNKTILSMRALDLIELNIRERLGKEFFYVDKCVCDLKMEMNCSLRRRISYKFTTEYSY